MQLVILPLMHLLTSVNGDIETAMLEVAKQYEDGGAEAQLTAIPEEFTLRIVHRYGGGTISNTCRGDTDEPHDRALFAGICWARSGRTRTTSPS